MNLKKIQTFLAVDLWRFNQVNFSRPRWIGVQALRVAVLTARALTEGRWAVRSSAMTFYTLLSIVPALAMVFGVAQGFGFEKALKESLYRNFAGQEEVVSKVVEFANSLLENFQGGLMAIVGLLILLYAVFRLMMQIEFSFNDIWGLAHARSWPRRITDYLAVMIIFPSLLVFSSILTISKTGMVESIISKAGVLSVVSPIMYFTLNLTPYAAMWVLLAFLYIFMPNTKVPYKSGLLAGFVAGSLFNLFQWAYVFFQVGLARYNAIYGSFAALPLFILWLNYSWTIVLLGAEMACAHQNASARRFSLGGDELSHRARRLLALGVMHRLVRSFEQKGDHQDARSLAAHFKIGTPQIESIVQELIQAGLVSAVRRPEDEHLFYQPGRDPDKMTIWSVCREWESVGAAPDLVDSPDDERRRLADSLEKLDDQAERSPANRRLKDV